jgi:hypothetical protein
LLLELSIFINLLISKCLLLISIVNISWRIWRGCCACSDISLSRYTLFVRLNISILVIVWVDTIKENWISLTLFISLTINSLNFSEWRNLVNGIRCFNISAVLWLVRLQLIEFQFWLLLVIIDISRNEPLAFLLYF